jgi:hypothetical protein
MTKKQKLVQKLLAPLRNDTLEERIAVYKEYKNLRNKS